MAGTAVQRRHRAGRGQPRGQAEDRPAPGGRHHPRDPVQEGSEVHAGDPLVALEDVRARSERAVLHQQSVALQAEIARLRAELHDAAEISFPGDVEASRGDAELDRMIAMQVELFEAHRAVRQGRKRITAEHIAQLLVENPLTRTMVRAPIDGRVVDLKATTVGGVLKPGEPILDIMPSRAELLIEARLRPVDIKDVRRGLPAHVLLTAYPQRNLPIIHGSVREVSADRLLDDRTGQPYFEVQIAVDDSELAKLADEVALLSGMPAEVFILTSDRTLLDYLARPFYDAVRRAFRER